MPLPSFRLVELYGAADGRCSLLLGFREVVDESLTIELVRSRFVDLWKEQAHWAERCLVTRAWLHVARRRLFASIDLGNMDWRTHDWVRDDLGRWEHVPLPYERESLPTLLRTLESSPAHLRPTVQSLKLNYRESPLLRDPAPAPEHRLPPLVQLLASNLQVLEIDRWPTSGVISCPNLRTLKLNLLKNCHQLAFSAHQLGVCPALETLSIHVEGKKLQPGSY